jgi:hypothetical protein
LVTRKEDLGGIDVGTTVAKHLLTPFQIRTFGNVTEILELNLRLADFKEGIVLVALSVQVLSIISLVQMNCHAGTYTLLENVVIKGGD